VRGLPSFKLAKK
jgi:hypothetical protein